MVALLVFFTILFSLEVRPYPLLMLKECWFYGDRQDIINCESPASVEQLYSWLIKATEQEKIALTNITDMKLVTTSPSLILQAGLDFLPNLKSLTVDTYGLDVIQANTFSAMSRLESLFISGAWNTTLDDKVLTGLANLKKLGISTSAIFNLNNLLKEVPSITYFRIGSNFNLHSIKNEDFEGVPNLIELRIYDTSVKEIEPQAFSNLKKLEILNIGANSNIRSLDERLFNGLHLKTLDLASNSFISVPHLFGLEQSLEYLDLSYNKIESIEQSKFAGLTKLINLDLSNNQIHVVPQDAFTDLPGLNSLDLSDNKINEIGKGAFKNLVALRKLNLNKNDIKNLPDDMFPDDSNLEELHLAGNPIKAVDNLKNILKQLKILELTHEQ